MRNKYENERDFRSHLQKEHKIPRISNYIREIVYGGNDGIVTTFAVVAGFAGINNTDSPVGVGIAAVLLFGLANLFADALSMGLGNFLSLRAQRDKYRKLYDLEYQNIMTREQDEVEETTFLLEQEGFQRADAEIISKAFSKNPKYWTKYMMNYEYSLDYPEDDNPILLSIATSVSFVIFGFIPLISYILPYTSGNRFMWSLISTSAALFALGVLRWRISKGSFLKSILETLFIGGISSLAAYLVGTLF